MKNIQTIITLLVGALAGFAACQLFHPNGPDTIPSSVNTDYDVLTLKKKWLQVQTRYQWQIDSVVQRTTTLQQSLKKTRTALDKTERKNIQLQTQVYDLIDRQHVFKEEQDTASYITGCDSLEKKVGELLIETNARDSLQTIVTDNLQQQMLQKDSIILLKDVKYNELDKTLQLSLGQQKILEQQTRFWQKKLKRQKLGSRLKSLGLLLISGFAAKQLIQ